MNTLIFLNKRFYNPTSFRKKVAKPLQCKAFSETSTFYHLFTFLTVGKVCNIQINKNLLITQQNNNSFKKESLHLPFTSKKKMTPSITKGFRNIHVLPHAHDD